MVKTFEYIQFRINEKNKWKMKKINERHTVEYGENIWVNERHKVKILM